MNNHTIPKRTAEPSRSLNVSCSSKSEMSACSPNRRIKSTRSTMRYELRSPPNFIWPSFPLITTHLAQRTDVAGAISNRKRRLIQSEQMDAALAFFVEPNSDRSNGGQTASLSASDRLNHLLTMIHPLRYRSPPGPSHQIKFDRLSAYDMGNGTALLHRHAGIMFQLPARARTAFQAFGFF